MHEVIDRTAFVMLKREQYCKDCAKRKDSNGKTVYQIGDVSCRSCRINDVLEDVEDFPPSAVRIAVNAEWQEKEDGAENWYVCSACGEHIPDGKWGQPWHSNYCPGCGAKMEG